MLDYAAVMVVGHFVVSVFQVPLGQPVWQFIPHETMEECREEVQYNILPQEGYPLSLEYKMYKTAQCVTREEFLLQMQRQQQMQQQNQDVPEIK